MKNENENEIDYGSLKIDKEGGNGVVYNDEYHKYWTKDTKLPCISVTTLIHQFTTFDEAFWSKYKALEALLSEEDFKTIKAELLKTKVFLDRHYEMFNISENTFVEQRQAILAEWKRKRDESCVRGTAIHREQELLHLAGETKELQHLGLGGKFKTDTSNIVKPGKQGIYPELLMSRVSEDGILRIAGQADLIIIDGKDVYVLDYKTNKSIDKKAFFDSRTRKASTMKYPLNHIPDVNFWHYQLQLSTYAWMIQKMDPELNIKALLLIHYDHDGGCTTYECEYLKKDVESMLSFHKKQVMNEEFRAKHKKMIF